MLATSWARLRRWRLSFVDRPKEQCRGRRVVLQRVGEPGLRMDQFVPKGAGACVMPVALVRLPMCCPVAAH